MKLSGNSNGWNGELTPRELEVLKLLAHGHSRQQVATKLSISANTVNRHTTNLMAKLGVHNRAELTRAAIRAGHIDP